MTIQVHLPVIDDFGGSPIATHDHACPVCMVNHSVLDLTTGRFNPCWYCQADGWRLKQSLLKRAWSKWLSMYM